jgi:hypothetical protein
MMFKNKFEGGLTMNTNKIFTILKQFSIDICSSVKPQTRDTI